MDSFLSFDSTDLLRQATTGNTNNRRLPHAPYNTQKVPSTSSVESRKALPSGVRPVNRSPTTTHSTAHAPYTPSRPYGALPPQIPSQYDPRDGDGGANGRYANGTDVYRRPSLTSIPSPPPPPPISYSRMNGKLPSSFPSNESFRGSSEDNGPVLSPSFTHYGTVGDSLSCK
jgi:hypothetical protein